MKKIYALFCMGLLWSIMLSCEEQEQIKNEIPDEIISKLERAGFDTSEGLSKYRNGYLVEYDIFFTASDINRLHAAEKISKTAEEEHYRTTNIVNGTPRTILVYMDPGFGSYMQEAFDAALARYNQLNLVLTFQRTTSSSNANIRVLSFYEDSNVLGVSAGFPSSSGNPASPIQLNTKYYNDDSQRADAVTVIAHEIGHAIGFRHTDYMRRRFSCGRGGNEGAAPYGAQHIAGTPTGPESGSYMLACSNGSDRPFTSGDRTALTTLY